MLDIRITNNARFMDQKVTPDVLSIIADCVVKYLELCNNRNRVFTVKSIWELEYFNNKVKTLYSKPDANEETAKCEYDKFIGQPLKMLSYAGVLNCEKRGTRNYFKVKDYKLLEYISINEKNAFEFIVLYIENVLQQSGLLLSFQNFKESNTVDEFIRLKDTFINFIIKYTKINGSQEVSRIFTKILNPYAVYYAIRGTEKGRISNQVLLYSDLSYNRENWRDEGKEKQITRQMHVQRKLKGYSRVVKSYYIKKAKYTL